MLVSNCDRGFIHSLPNWCCPQSTMVMTAALTMVVAVRRSFMSPSYHALLDLTCLDRTWLDNLMSDVLSLLLDLTALASLSQITRLLSRSRQSFQIVLGFNRSWTRTPGKHYFFLRNSMIEQFNEHQERETPRSCWDIFPSLDFLKPPSQKDWVRSSALKI